MLRPSLALLLASVGLLTQCNGFAFDLPAKKHRCFTEELPTGVELKVQYLAAPGYAQFIDVKLTNPENKVVWEELGTDRGSYAETVAVGGDYALCFYSRLVPGARYQEGMKRVVNVEFQTGTETKDYASLATRDHLKPMEVDLRVMEDVVRSLNTEYEYYKTMEAQMRDTNEHMNAKIMWCTIAVMSLILSFSIWQVRHLKHYFRKKRMID
jgi:hypothetical protein